ARCSAASVGPKPSLPVLPFSPHQPNTFSPQPLRVRAVRPPPRTGGASDPRLLPPDIAFLAASPLGDSAPSRGLFPVGVEFAENFKRRLAGTSKVRRKPGLETGNDFAKEP